MAGVKRAAPREQKKVFKTKLPKRVKKRVLQVSVPVAISDKLNTLSMTYRVPNADLLSYLIARHYAEVQGLTTDLSPKKLVEMYLE